MQTITLETDRRGVATLMLNRREKHNALSREMIDDLTDAARVLGADKSVRVVVLRAAGKSFCAGGDLAWMRAQFDAEDEVRRMEAKALADMLKALNDLPKPLIGALQGHVFGGGVGLASVCDHVVACDGIKLGLTETKLGIIPATIGPYVLARVGAGMARRIFMSSRLFDAQEAFTLGLVGRVVSRETLDQAIEEEVLPYLECKPGAVAAAKNLIADLGYSPTDDQIETSINALVARWASEEAQQGISEFFDGKSAI